MKTSKIPSKGKMKQEPGDDTYDWPESDKELKKSSKGTGKVKSFAACIMKEIFLINLI